MLGNVRTGKGQNLCLKNSKQAKSAVHRHTGNRRGGNSIIITLITQLIAAWKISQRYT